MGANSSDADSAAGLFIARRRRRRGSADLLAKSRPGDAAPVVFGDWLFGAASSAQALTQSARLDNSAAFYAATVTPGSVMLTPGLYTNDQTFYAPTVAGSGGPQSLTQDTRLDNNSGAFYAPTVTPGAVTLTPVRLENTQAFYAPTVTPGAVTLTPARFDSAQTFYAATVTPGVVTLTAARYDNDQVFYSPTFTPGAITLTPGRLDNSEAFYAPNVTHGAVTLTPDRFDNEQTFYSATVSDGAVTLTQDARFDHEQIFYAPTVAQSQSLSVGFFDNSAGLSSQQAAWLELLARVNGCIDPLVITSSQRGDGSFVQAATQSGAGYRWEVLSGPTGAAGSSGLSDQQALWLELLARRFGLIDPQIVTATGRNDGTLVQSIVEASGIVTVTRVSP